MKWNTGLPKKSGEYVCFTIFGNITTYHYSSFHKYFNCYDIFTKKTANEYNVNDNIVKWVSLEKFLTNEGL